MLLKAIQKKKVNANQSDINKWIVKTFLKKVIFQDLISEKKKEEIIAKIVWHMKLMEKFDY